MRSGQIYPRFRTVSASLLLESLGQSLQSIADEDRASDTDLGATLGKSKDSAERYRKAAGEMGVIAFLRGCAAWDGRFANGVLNQIGMKLVDLDASDTSDRESVTTILRAAIGLQQALEDDNEVDDEELAANRAAIEAAGKVFDRYRERLRLRAVA